MSFSAFQLWRIFYPALPVLGLLIIAAVRPQLGRRHFRNLENRLTRLARKPWLAGSVIGLTALAFSLTLSLWVRWPQPVIADEFSYLLAADTFAHGRLANPPHSLWQHFESLHILQQPTYASKYPPAQGLALAAGQCLTGWPIVGAWCSVALACVAIYWMLLAWMASRWALLGGWLAATHPMLLEWGQNFWGGAVALLGGALVIGALSRLVILPRWRDGWLLGVGFAILANSRPFEGMVLSLVLLVAALAWLFTLRNKNWRQVIARALPPTACVLVLTGAAMLYYNHRLTGNAFKLPYALHEETYAVAPAFVFQSLRTVPMYRHPAMREFYTGYATDSYAVQQSFTGFLSKGILRKLRILVRGYWAPLALALPLISLLVRRRRNPLRRWAFFMLAAFTILLLAETWMLPHYAAPGAGLIFFIGVCNQRELRVWRWRGQRAGLWLARGSLLCSFFSILNLAILLTHAEHTEWAWAAQRARIQTQLENTPGQHLVIIHYAPNHVTHQEWVYNRADFDNAKVVWARAMSETENRRLSAHFSSRQLWWLEADAPHPQPRPYVSLAEVPMTPP